LIPAIEKRGGFTRVFALKQGCHYTREINPSEVWADFLDGLGHGPIIVGVQRGQRATDPRTKAERLQFGKGWEISQGFAEKVLHGVLVIGLVGW
jgi:hypothetical protein